MWSEWGFLSISLHKNNFFMPSSFCKWGNLIIYIQHISQVIDLVYVCRILSQLPKYNHSLLCHFLCILHHISRRSMHNLMSASNLGVCVGPSLLWVDVGAPGEDVGVVTPLVECLVSNCQLLCGSHIPHLLGDPRDSGTEESDCEYFLSSL